MLRLFMNRNLSVCFTLEANLLRCPVHCTYISFSVKFNPALASARRCVLTGRPLTCLIGRLRRDPITLACFIDDKALSVDDLAVTPRHSLILAQRGMLGWSWHPRINKPSAETAHFYRTKSKRGRVTDNKIWFEDDIIGILEVSICEHSRPCIILFEQHS